MVLVLLSYTVIGEITKITHSADTTENVLQILTGHGHILYLWIYVTSYLVTQTNALLSHVSIIS